jgi:DNA polymerase-3 subunit epsilon
MARPGSAAVLAPPAERGVQLAFDELDEPLRETAFVVVDLETTGGRAGHDAITEIGAVRVRGGVLEGEFRP